MSDFIQAPNTGSAFWTKVKHSEKTPDLYGQANIDGIIRKFSIWIKQTSTGNEMLTFTFYPPAETDQIQPQQERRFKPYVPPVSPVSDRIEGPPQPIMPEAPEKLRERPSNQPLAPDEFNMDQLPF